MNNGWLHYGKNGTWINGPSGGSGESWTYTLRTTASDLQYVTPDEYNKGIGII